MRLLRLWLASTAAVLLLAAVWAFAPLLMFLAVLVAALGAIAAAAVLLAHRLRAWRERQ